MDTLAAECASLDSVHRGFSLLLHRPCVEASTSSVVLTALCWDCTSRGWVSLSCRMLLMVATQARKAETRQGSRKGLQAGEWQVRLALGRPSVESSASPFSHYTPHPGISSAARGAWYSTKVWSPVMPFTAPAPSPLAPEQHETPSIRRAGIPISIQGGATWLPVAWPAERLASPEEALLQHLLCRTAACPALLQHSFYAEQPAGSAAGDRRRQASRTRTW